MASVTSLGVHRPSALPYLISEGILSSEPSDDTYTWSTVKGQEVGNSCDEEELVTTAYCTVWSRGGVIQRVFRFDVEGESVTQAVFTKFPTHTNEDSNIKNASKNPSIRDLEPATPNERLEVPKQRGINPKKTCLESSEAAPHGGEKAWKRLDAEGGKDQPSSHERALVVILKTQAHVFFLTGTSHIVHLPFEVDAVFPSIQGILLQRKLSKPINIPSTPQVPSVPNNSFAFSQSRWSSSPPRSQPLSNLQSAKEVDSPFLPLLRNLLGSSNKAPEAGLPRLFCLTDPLTEIGTVAVKEESGVNNSRQKRSQGQLQLSSLEAEEKLLYVSQKDELSQDSSETIERGPLLLAVTENEDTGLVNVWTVDYIDHRSSKAMHQTSTSVAGATSSRRRSSFAPGTATGTSTPTLKGAASGRESLGGTRSRRQISSDPTLNENPMQHQDHFLDSALGDAIVPAKSSRRVSGLLARADLSTSFDKATFSDLAGVHAGNRGARKGASFGPHTARQSFGPDNASTISKPHALHGLRTSLDSFSLHDPQLDDLSDDLDDLHDLRNVSELGQHSALKGLRKEILLSKVYSMPGEVRKSHLSTHSGANPTRKVITMKTPELSLGDASEDPVIIMCLVDRTAEESLVLQISAHLVQVSNTVPTNVLGTTSKRYKPRVTGMTRSAGILDVCKVGDNVCSRFLTLEKSKDAQGGLSLQAPWSLAKKVELPPSLYLHNPYQITNSNALQQGREGSFKRIFKHSPQRLVALQHSGCQGRFDVVDSEGSRHRLQLDLWPRNPLVRKIIKVTESVLISSAGDAETMLRGWWDTMSWLEARSEPEADLEWTATVVLLFSMGAAFVGDRRTEATARQKKKKGGLLRSSSGAATDLDSWDAMMAQEASASGVLPTWMKKVAWEWTSNEKVVVSSRRSVPSSPNPQTTANAVPIPGKSSSLLHRIALAREFLASTAGQIANGSHGYLPTASSRDPEIRRTALASVLISLHLLREELKLDNLTEAPLHQLTPILAQMGTWLNWETWNKSGYYILESKEMGAWLLEDSRIGGLRVPNEPFSPPSIFQFIESTNFQASTSPIITLLDVANSPDVRRGSPDAAEKLLLQLTPRTIAISNLLRIQPMQTMEARVNQMTSWGLQLPLLETLPESVAAPFKAAIASCQARPSTSWDSNILKIIGREDIAMLERDTGSLRPRTKAHAASSNEAIRDVHSICHSILEVDSVAPYDGSAELDRQSITRLLFKEDQRFAEAAKLVHPLHYPVARCMPEPEWSDTDLLEAQQELAKVVAVRTLSVSTGRGLLFYSARLPLLTEKFPIHGFTMSCIMKPADTTVTADRNQFTEDRISSAFFHAGVAAGLSISRDAKGIDTSWILFNKPKELNNRHAGFLLALGMNGHLKSIAKWVAFKYLTPKHTMTSIGLLLGLSASYMGTMDTLITRLLSVHVTRMLPQGAAELNLSPLTQTSGIMGIGLLYCNTQHRRMSEIMMSEMENTDQDDVSNPLENLRDEGYRLAAGFALGYINIGKGKDMKGLHDMRITERLLTLAVSTRRVGIVHLLDKAAAAATIATALIFMKTQDEALARKIDIPDTTLQFDYVRPDMFLLRTVARHLIMWDNIQASLRWMSLQLPLAYQQKSKLTTIRVLTSEDMPFFNIIAGLCLSIGLRFAGSGSLDVRNLLCHYLDQFMRICRLSTLSYDSKLARQTVRNCQDVVALAASCVMAGTGDLPIFRRLRSLHGRTDPDTPYGSHLAAHFAIGILFMGGGTHTFGTSNIAVASLLCALYPLFPNTVLDNKSHLQAFRHFWVLATERRCLVIRDVDTHRPISLPILLTLRTGVELAMTAPCLLPELQTIASIQSNDKEYWSVTLDIAKNPSHLEAFTRHQSLYVRRRAAYDAHASVFSTTMQALNDTQSAHQLDKQIFRWIFTLPALAGFDRAEQALVLPAESGTLLSKGTRGTVVDDRLVLEKACLESGQSERLWNLRILFAWTDGVSRRGEEWSWFGREVVEGLKARLAMKRWQTKERW